MFLEQCSFCGQTKHETDALIIGPEVSICEHCVAQCVVVLAQKINRRASRYEWQAAHEEGSAGE